MQLQYLEKNAKDLINYKTLIPIHDWFEINYVVKFQ